MMREMRAVLTRHRFDVDEYHGMARAGILDEDHRVELLDGEIVELHGIGSRHFACFIGLHRALAAGSGYTVSTRLTEGPLAPVAFPDIQIDVRTILPAAG